MNSENPQLTKELQHPTSKYDYDGITGTWLLIPAKFHILMLAIALPVILWMFPFIHLKGHYRYLFSDYRYYIAGAVALFCLASALLSVVKAKQVRHRIRPISDVTRQGVTKSTGTRAKVLKSIAKHPKINLGHIQKKPTSAKVAEKEKRLTPKSSSESVSKISKKDDSKVAKESASNRAIKTAPSSNKKIEDQPQILNKKEAKTKSNNPTTSQKSISKASIPKRKKNPKQMQLDL